MSERFKGGRSRVCGTSPCAQPCCMAADPAGLQVSSLRGQLEMKLSVLALPLDICVQQAVRGESSLQGVLDTVTKAWACRAAC